MRARTVPAFTESNRRRLALDGLLDGRAGALGLEAGLAEGFGARDAGEAEALDRAADQTGGPKPLLACAILKDRQHRNRKARGQPALVRLTYGERTRQPEMGRK